MPFNPETLSKFLDQGLKFTKNSLLKRDLLLPGAAAGAVSLALACALDLNSPSSLPLSEVKPSISPSKVSIEYGEKELGLTHHLIDSLNYHVQIDTSTAQALNQFSMLPPRVLAETSRVLPDQKMNNGLLLSQVNLYRDEQAKKSGSSFLSLEIQKTPTGEIAREQLRFNVDDMGAISLKGPEVQVVTPSLAISNESGQIVAVEDDQSELVSRYTGVELITSAKKLFKNIPETAHWNVRPNLVDFTKADCVYLTQENPDGTKTTYSFYESSMVTIETINRLRQPGMAPKLDPKVAASA